MHCTCWSHCKLVTSTEYLAVTKSLHFFWLFTCCGGVRRVCGVNEADCACVSEAVVLAEEGREAVSLRIRLARLVLSRLPGSLKLFDDRTGQHHRRWRWGGGCAGGWCWCWWWGMESCHLYTAVSFILSSSPPLLLLPVPSFSPPPLQFLCCLAPSLRPLQAL